MFQALYIDLELINNVLLNNIVTLTIQNELIVSRNTRLAIQASTQAASVIYCMSS